MKETGSAPLFDRWSPGYGVFTYSSRDLDILIAYVQNQEAHHIRNLFRMSSGGYWKNMKCPLMSSIYLIAYQLSGLAFLLPLQGWIPYKSKPRVSPGGILLDAFSAPFPWQEYSMKLTMGWSGRWLLILLFTKILSTLEGLKTITPGASRGTESEMTHPWRGWRNTDSYQLPKTSCEMMPNRRCLNE